MSSVSCSSRSPPVIRPALLTSRSTCGRAAAPVSIDSRDERSSATSRISAAPPAGAPGDGVPPGVRAPQRSSPSGRRASSSATARPIPRFEPVTSAVSPVRSMAAESLLHHVRTGTGEPLILIHPLGAELVVWEPVLSRLAEHRDVIAVDLPGFGSSPPLPAGQEPTPQALAAALGRFLDRLGLGRAHVA